MREDFDGPGLGRLARALKDAGQSRRHPALAEIYDGAKRTDAARLGDVGLQVVRDWVLRSNAKGPAGLIDDKATGKPRKLNNAQRPGACPDRREWADPGDPRFRALAPQGLGVLDIRGVSYHAR